jgi:hypothetical protein
MKSVFRDYLIQREKDLIKARSIQGLQPSQIPEDLKAFDGSDVSGGGMCKCKPCAYCKKHKGAPAVDVQAIAPAVVEAIVEAVEVAKPKRVASAKQLEWRGLVSAVMAENPGMKISEASKIAKERRNNT